jgi:hypothetical protein
MPPVERLAASICLASTASSVHPFSKRATVVNATWEVQPSGPADTTGPSSPFTLAAEARHLDTRPRPTTTCKSAGGVRFTPSQGD